MDGAFGRLQIAGATTGWLWDEAQRLTGALEREAGRRRADALAHASEERLRRTIEASVDGVLIFDERARLVLANPAAERILGRDRDELLGRLAADLVESMGGVLVGSPLGDPRGDGEVSLVRPDGARVLARVSVSPLAGEEGPLGGSAVTIHDATAERSLAEEQSVRLQLLDEAARYAVGAASAAAAGEWLLAQLSSAWSLVAAAIYLLEADTTNRLAAWSPPELGWPLPALVPEDEAPALRELAAAGPVRLPLERLPATPVSRQPLRDRGAHALLAVPLREGDALVGILLAGDRHDPEPLTAHQLDELASTGRLAAAIVRRAERDEEAARRRIRDRIEHLLAHPDHLAAVFQPIVSVDRWRIVGYEALARFRVGPPRSPGAWFAEAVEVGLSAELQSLAIGRARETAARARLPLGTFLSVNVRPQDLDHPLVTRALGSGSLERLVIEVTEDEPIRDYPAMRAAMRPYLARGARFAIDDAGAGFASMRHVTELHPAFVKLDAQLVRGLGDDEARQALVAPSPDSSPRSGPRAWRRASSSRPIWRSWPGPACRSWPRASRSPGRAPPGRPSISRPSPPARSPTQPGPRVAHLGGPGFRRARADCPRARPWLSGRFADVPDRRVGPPGRGKHSRANLTERSARGRCCASSRLAG